MLGLGAPGIFIPTVFWLQVFLAVCCCSLIWLGYRMARGMVLVISGERFWTNGRWRSNAEVTGVTLGSLPWGMIDLPQLVLATSAGTDISTALWRFREPSAVRAGKRLGEQLGVPFV